MEDIELVCVDCKQSYWCPVGEQQLFLERGFVDDQGRVKLPIRCVGCRKARKRERRQEEKGRW